MYRISYSLGAQALQNKGGNTKIPLPSFLTYATLKQYARQREREHLTRFLSAEPGIFGIARGPPRHTITVTEDVRCCCTSAQDAQTSPRQREREQNHDCLQTTNQAIGNRWQARITPISGKPHRKALKPTKLPRVEWMKK